MDKQQKYKHPKRKFHDAWAFILFIIVVITCNIFYLVHEPKEKLIKFEMSNVIYFTIGYVALWMLMETLCLLCLPEAFMHACFFISPILSIGLAVWIQNTIGIIMALVNSAFMMFIYFFYYKKHIKYSAAVVRASSKSVVRFSYVVIPTVLITCIASMAQIILMSYHCDKQVEDAWPLFVVLVFETFWIFFTMLYFGRVFVSSIVALDLITVEEGISVVGEAFKNSLYCLGSICFASLIIALISTLRFFHDRSRSNDRDKGLLVIILQAIIGLILALLQQFIEFANHWALVYMSLYGTKYIQSVKESFDLVMLQRNYILVNNLCLIPVMNVLSVSMAIGYLLLLKAINFEFTTVEQIITAILVVWTMFLLNDIYMNIYDTGCKAFLFAYHKDPVAVKNKYSETYYMLEEQKYK